MSLAKHIVVERCDAPAPVTWEQVAVLELEDNDGRVQVQTANVNRVTAHYLKFKVLAGWSDFCTVHKVSVEGDRNAGGGKK
jgi:hypothetical protein